MLYMQIKASFRDVNEKNADTYTLYGRSDIPPAYVASKVTDPPFLADRILWRANGFPHTSHILPCDVQHISSLNNGWAWVFESNPPPECGFRDFLALDNSNALSALLELIRKINEKKRIDALANVVEQKRIEQINGLSNPNILSPNVEVNLPDEAEIYAMLNINNVTNSLYIYAHYDSERKQAIVRHYYVTPFNPNESHVTPPTINTSNSSNVLELIQNIISCIEATYNTKVRIFNSNISENLVTQPV